MTNATAFFNDGSSKRISCGKNRTAFSYICKHKNCLEIVLDCGLSLMRDQIKPEYLNA